MTKPSDRQIKSMQKQLEEEDRKAPQSAEKRVKITGSFDQTVRKMARAKPPKKS